MQRATVSLAVVIAFAAGGSVALAANSTNEPPPTVDKEGGIAGDPRGAIRALGGSGQTGFKQSGDDVSIPHLGGSPGAGRVDGTPPGTTGPR